MSRRILLPIDKKTTKRLVDYCRATHVNHTECEYLLSKIGAENPTDIKGVVLINKKHKNRWEGYDRLGENDIWACRLVYTDYGGEGLTQMSIIVAGNDFKMREDWHETLKKPRFSRDKP
jgi:hypothetical protein